MTTRALTAKQEAFVREYLIDLNATKAAARAGYSKKTAHVIAHELMRHPVIAERIAQAQQQRAEKAEVTAERVLEELAMLAFYDPADLATVVDEDTGEPLRITGPEQIAKLPKHIRKAIVGWGWDKAGNFTLRFAPKTATLELIGRHLGMFKQEIDLTVYDGVAKALESARRRAIEAQAVTRH